MKRIPVLFVTLLLFTLTTFGQTNKTDYRLLAGKKIKSVIIRNTTPAGGGVSKPVNIGSTTITSGNAAAATSTVNKELQFTAKGDVVELERKFTRIATRTVNPMGERIVDTDNPFERPASMVKLGEKYDNLVKIKAVTQFSNGVVNAISSNKEFEFSWNEFLPFFSLDSALNTILLSLPSKHTTGTSWTDSAANEHISVKLVYTIQQKNGDTLVVSYQGVNNYTPPVNKSNNVNINIYKLQSFFEGTQKADAKTGLIYSTTITGATKTRKLVLGQEMDNEIKEEVTITNTVAR